MSTTVACPGCSGLMSIAEVHDGKRVRCGRCRTISVVRLGEDGEVALDLEGMSDRPPAESIPSCTSCGESLTPDEKFCPKCGTEVPVAEGSGGSRTPRRSRTRIAVGKAKRKTVVASRWILAISILFSLLGTIQGIAANKTATKALENLEGYPDEEIYPDEIDGEVYTFGEMRDEIRAEPRLVFVTNYLLALIMFGLFLWSKKSPLPAIVSALGIYLVLQVLNGIIDPTMIVKGIIFKVLIIAALVSGIKAALTQREIAQREARKEERVTTA